MHVHDRQWVESQIALLPVSIRQKTLRAYNDVFKEAHDAEPIEHKKMNKARFAANTRLREYVEKILKNS